MLVIMLMPSPWLFYRCYSNYSVLKKIFLQIIAQSQKSLPRFSSDALQLKSTYTILAEPPLCPIISVARGQCGRIMVCAITLNRHDYSVLLVIELKYE